jgi:hypothetical protein
VTFRLGTGKSLTFSYSVRAHRRHGAKDGELAVTAAPDASGGSGGESGLRHPCRFYLALRNTPRPALCTHSATSQLLQFRWKDERYTVKKRLAIFPSPAGMSLNKLSLAGNTCFYSVVINVT